MDYFELLLADRVRQRADDMRAKSMQTFLQSRQYNGGATEHDLQKWTLDNPDVRFLRDAYEELIGVARFLKGLEGQSQ